MAKQTGGLPAANGEAEATGAPEHTLGAQDAQLSECLTTDIKIASVLMGTSGKPVP